MVWWCGVEGTSRRAGTSPVTCTNVGTLDASNTRLMHGTMACNAGPGAHTPLRFSRVCHGRSRTTSATRGACSARAALSTRTCSSSCSVRSLLSIGCDVYIHVPRGLKPLHVLLCACAGHGARIICNFVTPRQFLPRSFSGWLFSFDFGFKYFFSKAKQQLIAGSLY